MGYPKALFIEAVTAPFFGRAWAEKPVGYSVRYDIHDDDALPATPAAPCPCTLIEQDEDCPIGQPSLLCGVCDGTGNTTPDKVQALAAEMLRIASDLGEPEDPFAAWEHVQDGISAQAPALKARPLEEWHEDTGDCVWWCWEKGAWLGEAAWIGSPIDSDWPGYHTHFTPHPDFPPAIEPAAAQGGWA